MKKTGSMLLCAVFLLAMSACGFTGPSAETSGRAEKTEGTLSDKEDTPKTQTDDAGQKNQTIAVLMPDETKRWSADAAVMKNGLEELGYTVSMHSAGDDAARQAAQMEECINTKADCLITAAADTGQLAAAAAKAGKAGIPLIAYDRLLMDTDAVSFYVTYDHKGAGNMMGRAAADYAGLDSLKDGEYRTIEFFMGPADDADARLVYDGMMEALQPYLDDGRLVCRSGNTSFEETSTAGNEEETARQRCADYLERYYEKEDLAICAAACDSLAYGCRAACLAAGYTQDNWPVISGQDCELDACRHILEGTQTFSIYKDTAALAKDCVQLTDAVLNGIPPQVNDTQQYDNGVMTVPAHTCMPAAVDKTNLEEVIIDSGYYTKAQLAEEE